MARNRLESIRACIFDAYGTLFDYRSAASRCRDVLGENFDQVNALWREKQLQYSWLRAIQGRHVDFWQVTGEALDFALDTAAIADSTVRDRLMDMYLKLDAFPEVPDMLKRLNVAGLKTAILSNGSPEMLDAAVRNAGIGFSSMQSYPLKPSVCTSLTRRSTSTPSISWELRLAKLLFSLPMPGTHMLPRCAVCASSGATVIASARNACQDCRILRSRLWQNSRIS